MINALPDAKAHAEARFPLEAGGVFVQIGDDVVFRPSNYISRVDDHFAISPHEWLEAERDGKIVGFFHSHVDWPPIPSRGDGLAIDAWGKPWIIMSLPSGEWAQFVPKTEAPRLPLLGRGFVWDKADCWTLIKDHYARLGVPLIEVPRAPGWELRGENLYMENIERAGFVKQPRNTELQLHDLILLQIGRDSAGVPNHGAIYIGGGHILHHIGPCDAHDARIKLSARAVYGDFYQTATRHIYRHGALCR